MSEEYLEAFWDTKYLGSSRTHIQRKAVKYLMKKHDFEGEGGRLDKDEFKKVLEHVLIAKSGGDPEGAKSLQQDDVDHFFSEADRDLNGYIDSTELLMLLRSYSAYKMADPALRALIHEHDDDESGSIDTLFEMGRLLEQVSVWKVTPQDSRFVLTLHRQLFFKSHKVNPKKKTSPRALSRAISTWYRYKVDAERYSELWKQHDALKRKIESDDSDISGDPVSVGLCQVASAAAAVVTGKLDLEEKEDLENRKKEAQDGMEKIQSKWRGVLLVMLAEWKTEECFAKPREEAMKPDPSLFDPNSPNWLQAYDAAYYVGLTGTGREPDEVLGGKGDKDAKQLGLMAGIQSRIAAMEALMPRKNQLDGKKKTDWCLELCSAIKKEFEFYEREGIPVGCESFKLDGIPRESWTEKELQDCLEKDQKLADHVFVKSLEPYSQLFDAWYDLADIAFRRSSWITDHKLQSAQIATASKEKRDYYRRIHKVIDLMRGRKVT